jgi:hypothetical protein
VLLDGAKPLTEEEWLRCTDTPGRMVRFLRERFPLKERPQYRRKLRLFACEGCRRHRALVAHRLKGRVSVRRVDFILEVMERAADGLAGREEVARARRWATEMRGSYGSKEYRLRRAVGALAEPVAWDTALGVFNAGFWAAYEGDEPLEDYLRARCLDVREVFGNPFRPPAPRSFPANVLGLAQSCYEGDHVLYPVLGDALEDLGEVEAAGHCRQGTHFKGCHVVDWVLGKG